MLNGTKKSMKATEKNKERAIKLIQKVKDTMKQKKEQAMNAKGNAMNEREANLKHAIEQVDLSYAKKEECSQTLATAQQNKINQLGGDEDDDAQEALNKNQREAKRAENEYKELEREYKNLKRRQQSGGKGNSYGDDVLKILRKLNASNSPIKPDQVRGPFAEYIKLNDQNANASEWAKGMKIEKIKM